MVHRCLPLALLIAGFAFTGLSAQSPLPGKPPDKPPLPGKPPPEAVAALIKLTGAKAADLHQAVRGVCVYPGRTRHAILDLAKYAEKYPKLLADLTKLRTGSAEAIDRYLTSNKYEPELQQAAAIVLVEAPETVERMQERPDLVRIVGIAWSTPPGRDLISAVLDTAASNQEKIRTAAADRWASRLKADPALMKQFIQLLEDYTRRTTAADQQPDDTWQSYGYGAYKTKDGYVVNDVPSQEVVSYALAVGPQYNAVADALIQQYLSGQNQDDFNTAVGGWYTANGDLIPQSSRQNNSDYYDLLKELAALADAYNASGSGTGDGSGSGDGSGNNSGNTASGNTVNNFLTAKPSDFPKLAEWAKKNPGPKLGQPSDLTRLKDGPGSGKPPIFGKDNPAKPSASPFADRLKATPANDRARPMPQGAKNPFSIAARAPVGAPKLSGHPQQLFRANPSMGHQLSRAPVQMQTAWRPQGGGRPKR
jgi:hypothetical protein